MRNGWFYWPYNFDPQWLLKCAGYVKLIVPKLPFVTRSKISATNRISYRKRKGYAP